MLRRAIVLTVLTVLGIGLTCRGRADDEPTFLDRKLSYWMALLSEGKDAKARRRGVVAVEQIGHSGSRKVVPALIKALQEDSDASVRAAAARAVGRAVAKALEQAREDKKDDLPRFDNAREALTKMLRTDKVDGVREASASALGDIGADARGAAGSLATALKDKHAPTVLAAATALRRMGRDARDAQDDLQVLLADRKAEPAARTEAAIALGQIKPDAAGVLPVLKEVLADEKADARTRKAVAEALGKLGKEAGEASATLGTVLSAKGSSTDLRLAAVTALDQMGPEAKAAIPGLVKAASDSDRFVRCLAMQVLGRMGKDLEGNRKEAVKALLRSAEESNVEVCVAAIESLGALSAEGLGGEADDAVKKLEAILRREGRKSIREAAQAAIDRIRPKKKEEKKEEKGKE
jgi:HEAT repeat protein